MSIIENQSRNEFSQYRPQTRCQKVSFCGRKFCKAIAFPFVWIVNKIISLFRKCCCKPIVVPVPEQRKILTLQEIPSNSAPLTSDNFNLILQPTPKRKDTPYAFENLPPSLPSSNDESQKKEKTEEEFKQEVQTVKQESPEKEEAPIPSPVNPESLMPSTPPPEPAPIQEQVQMQVEDEPVHIGTPEKVEAANQESYMHWALGKVAQTLRKK